MAKITEGVDALLMEAIKKGLEKGDANMVRVVHELRQQEDVEDVLKELDVEIVPYTIADTSLREIVLKAPDYIIEEIEEALKERRRLMEFGGQFAELEGDSG